ncbi:hypothetical protein J6590_034420 [Homalodisca vitripennis]|nr:hypothetical protein J6590_034420 [Homalodisca vitripennis]
MGYTQAAGAYRSAHCQQGDSATSPPVQKSAGEARSRVCYLPQRAAGGSTSEHPALRLTPPPGPLRLY